MKNIKFELLIYCTTGWDDNESIAFLQVGTFSQMIEAVSVLNKDSQNHNEEERQMYKDFKDEMESEDGEEIMYVGGVVGIQCIYEDEKGVQVKMTLNDESGVEGHSKVNGKEHENEYKRLLNEAKKFATSIVNL